MAETNYYGIIFLRHPVPTETAETNYFEVLFSCDTRPSFDTFTKAYRYDITQKNMIIVS